MAVLQKPKGPEDLLGWKVREPEKDSAYVAGRVVQTDGKKRYQLEGRYCLKTEEAKFIWDALENYRLSGTVDKFSAEEFFRIYSSKKKGKFDLGADEKLLEILKRSVAKEGMLSVLLEDENLEEIAVIGTGPQRPVFVFDSNFGWLETNFYFSSDEEVKTIVNATASESAKRLTFRAPKINFSLHEGSRVNACAEPLSKHGTIVTIRKFRQRQISLGRLEEWGCVSFEQLAFLWMAMQSDCSILVCGNTGSGKTTLLNAMLSFVPENERIIVAEDTPEIRVRHRHTVKLCTAEGIDVGLHELVINTLRMRPDRVVAGEVRDKKEVHALMDALLSGQGKGSYATFHAESAKDAIARLAGYDVSPEDIAALDLIITQKRWSVFGQSGMVERRRLVEICEPHLDGKTLQARQLYTFDFAKGKFAKKSESTKVLEKIMRTFGIGKAQIGKEIARRCDFLKINSHLCEEELFCAIQDFGRPD